MAVYAPTSPRIQPVRATDSQRVAGILARAFADDPIAQWLIPREPRLAPGFEFYLRRIWLPHDAVYESADGRAVACWLPPGKSHMSFAQQMRLLPGLAAVAGRHLPRLLSGTAAMDKDHPHDSHWFLNMMGVEPSSQGRGLGSALLAHTLDRCDATGSPAYLEATTERGCALYERHGFEVTEEARLPQGGPPFWRLWREPVR